MIQSLGAALSAPPAGQQRKDAPANETGNVSATGHKAPGNADLTETEVCSIVARTSYAAAVEALHVQDEMWASLLKPRR
jgi:hypothetical protein